LRPKLEIRQCCTYCLTRQWRSDVRFSRSCVTLLARSIILSAKIPMAMPTHRDRNRGLGSTPRQHYPDQPLCDKSFSMTVRCRELQREQNAARGPLGTQRDWFQVETSARPRSSRSTDTRVPSSSSTPPPCRSTQPQVMCCHCNFSLEGGGSSAQSVQTQTLQTKKTITLNNPVRIMLRIYFHNHIRKIQ
jgi:hypothetical protein